MKSLAKLLPEQSAPTLAGVDRKPLRTHLMEEKRASIKLEDGSLIKGKINLLAEPPHETQDHFDKYSECLGTSYTRISDIFTKGSLPFIVVFDVTLEGREGRVLIVNKAKIQWVSPED